MVTRFVGVKELGQNIAKISERMLKRGERAIVLRKNKPLFELRPLRDDEALVESFRRDIEEARADIRAGKAYTQVEVRKKLGL